MEKVTLSAIEIKGIKTRTNMVDEMNGTGKLQSTWNDFFKNYPDAMQQVSYGVYTNYSSEDCAVADFDIHIGTEQVESEISVTIPAGDYIVYSVQGEMPQAVIEAWPKIEEYLNSEGAEKANHICDFEKYLSMTEAEIYLSIEG